MRRLVLALALVLTAPASAQAPTFTLAFSPAKASRATTGTLAARDLPADPAGAAPLDVVVLALQRGFLTDPKGAPGRCSPSDADAVRCPDAARVGAGSAVVEASFAGAAQDYTAALQAFVLSADTVSLEIREPQNGVAASVRGRLVRAGRLGGPEVRFEGLSKAMPAPPPGFTVRIKSFEMAIGRRRTITRRVRTRSGKRRRVKSVRTVVRTPATCSGSWTATLALVRTDGTEAAQPLTAPCTR